MAAKTSFEYVAGWDALRRQRGWWHSFELPDGSRIEGVCPLEGLRYRLAQFPVPEDLSGKRVLDIGSWDGWFAFEMERRGASVLAIDNWDNPRFHEMRARLGSRVEYLKMDVYDLTPERLGRFDIVLFMGVLYHLKHPLLALEKVCALTTDFAAVDSFVLRDEQRPVMEFYERDEFGGQTDNWVGPSLSCLMAFCRAAGFARVELQGLIEYSACIACHRSWEPPRKDAPAGPNLLDAVHHRDFGWNFRSDRDEYVSAWFESAKDNLTIGDLKPEVGIYGVSPIHLRKAGQGQWETAFKLPPGLPGGLHNVRIRLRDSAPGSARPIAVDMPVKAGFLNIVGIRDGTTWKPDEFDPTKGENLSLWIEGLPVNADRNRLAIYLSDERLHVTYIELSSQKTARQVNALVSSEIKSGVHEIHAALGETRSLPRKLRVFVT